MTTVVRGGLLVALAGVIAHLLSTGQMALYMSSSLDPLTAATALVLAGMGGLELSSAWRASGTARRHAPATDEWLSYLLVAVFLGLGLLYTPRALDAAALGGQDAGRFVVAFSASQANGPPEPPGQAIQDVPDLLRYLRTAGEGGVGQPVRVVGLVASDSQLAEGQFVLLRYTIVHCVADAQPLGLLIVGTAPPGTNTWVEIEGTLASREQNGAHLISVVAAHVAAVDEPANPYLQNV